MRPAFLGPELGPAPPPRGEWKWGVGAVLLVAVVTAILLTCAGCFPGTDPHAVIQTSAGPREAGTVWSQDAVGDVLDALTKVQAAAVRDYQAPPPEQRDPKRRTLLLATQAGIRAGYDGLISWKLLSGGGGPDLVLDQIGPAAADLLALLEATGAIPPETAAKVRAFLTAAIGGTTP